MSTTQEAKIVISAQDRASAVFLNMAVRVEAVNKRLSRMSQAGQALGLLGEQMAKPWGNLKSAFTGVASGARTLAVWAGVAGGATAGLVKLATSASDAADKIGDLSDRYGVGTKTLQVYGAMVEAAGGTIEDAAAGIGKFKKAMNEATHGVEEQAAAFAGLGISVQQLKKMSPEEAMLKMSEAFKGSTKDMEKQAVLLALMGKNGTIFRDVMNKGPEEFKRLMAEMQADGRLLTEQQIADADKFDKAWRRATGAFEGIKNMLGLDLANALLPIIESVRVWATENRELIKSKFAEFLKHLPDLVKALATALKILWTILVAVATVFKWVGHVIGMQNAVLLGMVFAFAPLIVSLGKAAGALFTFGRAVFAAMGPIGLLLAAVLWLGVTIYENWDAIVGYVVSAWDRIKAVFEVNFFDGLIQLWLESWQGLLNGIVGIMKSIPLIGDIPAIKDFKGFTFATDRAQRIASQAQSTGSAPVTAAQAAATQKSEFNGKLKVEIDSNGKAKVTELRKSGTGFEIDASTGPLMMGA